MADTQQLLVVLIPVLVSFLKKTVLKNMNSSYIPVLVTVFGGIVGVTNAYLGTDFAVNAAPETINAVILAWSGIGVHQVYTKGRKLTNGNKISPGN